MTATRSSATRVRFVVAAALAVAPFPADTIAQGPSRLARLFDQPPLDRNLWGVAVLDARNRLLFGLNAERLFMPASNVKLAVSAVASALLPAEWTVTTSVYAGGPVTDGVLRGDLVLYGRGDPTLGRRCFAVDTLAPGACRRDPFEPLAQLAAAIRARGVARVEGDLIGDASWFDAETVHGTWEHDDLDWGYAAPVSALGFHENTVVLTVTAGATEGAPATVAVFPSLPGFDVDARIVTTADTTVPAWVVTRTATGIAVAGAIRPGAAPRRESLAVPDGAWLAAQAFRSVLADSGIVVTGATRAVYDSLATRAARASPPLADVVSRPLRDWVFAILNVSQNWYAELLLKHLGRTFGTAGSWREGLRVERRFLIDSVGLDSTQFHLHDGSGLSSKNLVTPLAFARILAWIRTHPRFPTFAAGLPQSGAIGSLRTRLARNSLAGRVRAKTGSIGQVNTLSGYVERARDATALKGPPERIFSIQANHHTLGGRAMIEAIDTVVTELARPLRGRRGPTP